FQRHGQGAIPFDGISKNFDAISAISNLLTYSLLCFWNGFDLRHMNMILFKVGFYIKRRSPFSPKRLADGKNSRPLYFTALDPAADQGCVLQHGCKVKNRGETPLGEHFLKLQINLLCRRVFGMKQLRRENMHVAVPEASSYKQTFAIDYIRMARDFDCLGGAYCSDFPIMKDDGAIFDGRLQRGSIDFCPDQGEIGSTA